MRPEAAEDLPVFSCSLANQLALQEARENKIEIKISFFIEGFFELKKMGEKFPPIFL
jgi:hypothetical protein